MQLKSFNIIIFIFGMLPAISNSMTFDENVCFKKKFDINLLRKVGPFGIGERKLSIVKKDCDIEVEYQSFQYNIKTWKIDICREPVHIKEGRESVKVIQKEEDCHKSNEDSFCSEKDMILDLLQNEGLIFADGAREDFNTDHGKTFCSYLLLKYYLNGQKALNRNVFFQGELLNEKRHSNKLGEKKNSKHSNLDLSVKSEKLFEF